MQIFPGVRALRMPCAKTVTGQIKTFLQSVGLETRWDAEEGCCTVDPEEVLKLCLESSLRERAIAQISSGEREEQDTTIELPGEVIFNVVADAAAVGNDHITTVGLACPDIHPKPGSPDSVIPVGIYNASDSAASVRRNVPAFVEMVQNLTSVMLGLTTINVFFNIMGDLHCLMSLAGLATCSCLCPCLFCYISKSDLGKFGLGSALRDLETQNGLSTSMLICVSVMMCLTLMCMHL